MVLTETKDFTVICCIKKKKIARYSMHKQKYLSLDETFLFAVSYLGSCSNQGINFSCTDSGRSSCGQWPVPGKINNLRFGSSEGREEKYFPTGPSRGVNGSSSPHRTKTGTEILGIRVIGLGPGGPVTVETNASRAPSSSAGLLII